ncbi:MAG: SRPBCC domain-containing protein [Blastocatellales bacterium]
MKKLYVERTIEIQATPSRVWDVLTKPEFTHKWAGDFGATGPIDSTWTLGSMVRWRNAKGEVYVHGKVTAVSPLRLLRFTVCDALNPELRPTSGLADDDITQSYSLATDGARTVLSTAHGDFGKLANGDTLYPMVIQLWDRLLPKIKELAECAQGTV